MLVSNRLLKSGHFIECLCEDALGNIVLGVMARDGLIYKFHYADIAHLLSTYPEDRGGWYWNSTRDRYAAEKDGETVDVNPMFVSKHFPIRLF